MNQPLPVNLEAEQALLGILLLGEEETWDEVAAMLTEGGLFPTGP